ncbi:MAG: PKD-like domain-containing protein [Flavobacteriaceae bacterium]
MKKLLILLSVALFFTSYTFAQGDLSGPKPIIKVYNEATGVFVNPDPALGNLLELGCGVGSFSVKATWTDIGSPDVYRVEKLDEYKPKAYLRVLGTTIFPPTNGAMLTNQTDDVWSNVFNLASNGTNLDFCFFGNQRNQFVISSNGAVSFNTAYAGGYSSWSIHNMGKIAPNAGMPGYADTILTPFHDTHPTNSDNDFDSYSYWDILGINDDRYFILGTHNMPMYSCGDPSATHQMVFYETTNIIEFHIQDKPICYNWAQGYAALGIQNLNLDLGYTASDASSPIGRDNLEHWRVTSDPNDPFFTTEPNVTFPPESWRFIPDGVLGVAPTFQWYTNYNHTTETGTVFGAADNPDLTVTVDQLETAGITTITYTAVVTYTDYCTGNVVNSATDVTFELEDPFLSHIKERGTNDVTVGEEDIFIEDIELCAGDNYTLETLIQNFDTTDGSTVAYEWRVTQFPTAPTVIGSTANYDIVGAVAGTYVYEVLVTHDSTMIGGDLCFSDDSVRVRVFDPGAVSFEYPSPAVYCATDTDPIPLNVTVLNGTYTINNGGVWVNPVVGTNPSESLDGIIDLSLTGNGDDNTGNFQITYTAGCANDVFTFDIVINNAPILTPPATGIFLCATNATLQTAEFDMAAIELEILNGQTGLDLLYNYGTPGGPVSTATMPNPFTTGTTTVSLTVNDPADPASCTSQLTINLTVTDKPIAGLPTNNLVLCENPFLNDGEAGFDGTYIENTVLNGTVLGLNYELVYSGDANGTAVTMPSNLPASYVSSTMTVTAFIRDINGNCDSDPVVFDLVVREIPEVSVPTNGLVLCESDTNNHTASFDTSTWDADILALNPTPINTDFIIEYTYDDGTGPVTVNAMPNPLVTGSQTITILSRNVTSGLQTCTSAQLTFSLVVNPIPVGSDQTPTTCSSLPVNFDLNTLTTGTGNTYSWSAVDNPNVTGETITASTTSSITDTLLNTSAADQTVIYTITPTGSNGCPGADFTISLIVQPEPLGVDTVEPACSNIAVNVDINSHVNGTGNTYSWVATDNPNITGETIVASTTTAITDTLINTSTTAQDIIYTVTPTGSNGCVGSPFIITINVGEEPVGTPTTEAACSDVATNFNLSTYTTLTGNTYSWIAADNPNVTGETLTTSTNSAITDTMNNVSGVPQDVVYTITPSSANGCVGTPFNITITVGEEPVGSNTPETTCSDVALNLDLNTYVTGTGNTFTWTSADNTNISGETASGTSATLTDTLTNVSGAAQTVVYTITPTSSNGCAGNPFDITVTINEEPVGSDSAEPACSAVAVNYDLNGYVTGTGNTYSWVATDNPNITGETLVTSTASSITDTLTNTGTTAQDIIYTVTPTGANGCTGDAFTFTITVGEEPVGSNSTEAACSNVATNFDLSNYTTLTGNTYSWVAADNANVTGETLVVTTTSSLTDTLINTSGTPQDVVYTVTPASANGCFGNPFTVTITVNEEPVGTDTPEGTCSDVALNLDLNAYVTGIGNTFTWTSADNVNITGETTSETTATITDTLTNVSGSAQTVVYTVNPTSANGCVGNAFDVTVTITEEPVGTDDIETTCSDVAVNYDLNTYTTGAGNTYTWVATDNTNVTGETTTIQATGNITDTLNNVSGVAQDVVYTITPTGTCLGDAFMLTITVNPEPVGADSAETACSDVATNFDLSTYTTLTGNTYSWIATDNANVTGETLVATTSSSLIETLTNISGTPQNVVYTVTPTSTDGCAGNPFTVTITVNEEPVGTNTPEGTCSDVALNLDLNNYVTGTGNTFTWTSADNANITGETVSDTSATITDTLTNVSGTSQTVVYTIIPTGSNGCEGNAFDVTVTIAEEPVGSDATATSCSDDTLNLSLDTYTTGTLNSYTWVAADNTNITGESTILQTTGLINDSLNNISGVAQDVVYTVIPTGGCLGDSFTVTVTVNPEPVGADTALDACSDVTTNFNLSSYTSLTGNTYSWIAMNNPNITGETLVTSTALNITDTMTNVSGAPQDVVYTITPTSVDGCEGNPFTITVTVGFEPIGANTTELVCSDEALNVNLESLTSQVGNTFSWTVADNTNITGETSGTSTDAFIIDTLNNVSGVVQVVTYTITPTSANNCEGNSFTVMVTVNPEPVGVAATASACSDTAMNLDLSTFTSLGATYSWVVADNASVTGETVGISTAPFITDTLNNVSGSTQQVVYTITVTSADGCEGNPFDIVVSVGEEPVGTPTTIPACSDEASAINLDDYTSLTGNTYSWMATDNLNVTGETTTATSSNSITDTITNTSGFVQNVVYTIIPTSVDGCAGNSFEITIEVGFEPVGTDTTEVTCNDEVLNLDLSNYTTLSGNSYTWMAIDNPNVTGETTDDTDSDFITDTITNTTGNVETVDYLIIPTSVGGCLGDAFTVSVDVNPRPQFVLNSQYYICPETQLATVGEDTNPTSLTYEWFVATDMTTPIGFDLTLDVTEADILANGGAYALTATDSNGCVYSQFTSISMADQLEITNIFVNDFNRPDNTITIEVTGGSGNYEYTLTDEDGNTTTQSSNVFNHVLSGTFEVEVVDLTGCSITRIQDDIYVLDYPDFFTPNGDLNYDTWQISNSHLIPNSKIYIYDRFGKVLAKINPNSVVGWDGLYNGKQMPASDYWFSADYIDPNTQERKTVRGHFSIIRK